MSDSKRRSELRTDPVEDLVKSAEREERAKHWTRDRSWDAQRVKASYDIPKELRSRIVEIAEAENVNAYDIARVFLQYGVKLYEEGGLEALGVEKREKAVEYDLTLG